MGKINGCLKCLFIFFNVLFAIVGCLLIFTAVKATSISYQLSAFGTPGLGWLWVFAIGVLGISCLGIYAGCSEKGIFLKIFAGFMGVGMVIMLIFGIVIVVARNKIRDEFKNISAEIAKPLMEDEGLRQLLEGIQMTAQCCGLSSASDWGNKIPESCECSSRAPGLFGGHSKCKPKPLGTMGPSEIYEQTCSDAIFSWVDLLLKIVMGFFFGFSVTALLGLVVSFLMIHQVKRHDSTGGSSMAMKGY
ncbi:tetraspanin-7-like [Seriola lalandi dorsalis]|uniref:Tetraspanin n=1 Tax=Seriola lalandi dorsalis TaxID=1841481 RepID=A0A3B4WG88_SERLL|nr:tetraspanin-7-like [Seriola lalandi dorsalis]XP_056223964.1 tetraspanin-7-like [Seriola aureovittata]